MEKCVSKLVSRFKQIGDEHIRDLPIYHRTLQVEAVDFQLWAQGWIGVLITPWFMNVMLLPRDKDQWQSLALGQKHMQKLPSGEQEFVVGGDAELGAYLFRSLASPMLGFPSQKGARQAAHSALQRLMAPPADAGTTAACIRG
jgi:[NiFe] hydrogenase assembly HybE family chaperone